MKKKIVAAVMAMVLAIAPCGSVLAEEIVQDDVVIEEISADEAVGLTDDEADTVELEIIEIESEDNFVIAVEEVETKSYDVSAEYEIALTEEITLELDVAGEAASAAPPYISLYSNTVYSGSYGAQLSEESKVIYDAMVTAYVDSGAMDGPTITLKNEFNMSIDNAATDAEILADANFKEALENLKYLMQPAYDAFVYDYPEVAWIGAVSYTPEILVTKTADGICTAARIPTVTLIPKEKYTGAKDDCSAFAQAVGTVVEALNCTESMTTVEKIKVIHDYLCEKIVYEETDYAHTAAGVFVRDAKVVCEGYAKAFKILCNKFDIECVLIPGYANGAHMWNYVKMDDGNWYVMDVTWDDKTPIDYTYFLVGSDTVSRTLYTNFSSSQYTQNFVLPFLSNQAYEAEIHLHTWEIISETAPTCRATGSRTYQCTDGTCGASVTETLGEDAHKWLILEAVSNGDATCTEDGTKTVTCSVCRKAVTITDTGSMLPHSWETEKTVDEEPTCTESGSKSIHCSICGVSQEGTEEEIDPCHSFTNYVSNNDAENCLDIGTKTAKCDNCDETDTIDDPDTVGDHVWETGKTVDKEPTCTEAGSKSIHCSLCDESEEGTEETVKATGHSFTKYTTNDDATCQGGGTKTAKCDNCDVTDTVDDLDTVGDHVWETDKTIDKEPTCTEFGSKSIHCSLCGTSKDGTSESIDPCHSFTNYVSNNDGENCLDIGTKTAKCDNCDETDTIDDPDTVGDHVWETNKTVDKEPTCTEAGSKSIHCSLCDESEEGTEETVKTTGHSFTNYITNNDATCQGGGTKTAKCDNCDETDTIDDPDTVGAHVWKSEKTVDKQPTCTETGSKSIHCSLCNTSKEGSEESVAAKGHSFTNYIYNNDATCTANGTKTAKCDNCTATSTIEAAGTQLSHSYSYVSNNDATVFDNGTKTASCAYGCGTTSTVTDAGTKLTPTWKLNASKITLKVGQSTTKVKVTGLAAGDSVKSWSSSNSKIVTAKNGKITAKKVGTAYVYVRLASDTSGTTPKIKIKVTVQKTAVKTTKIAGLSKTMTIAKGKKETLSPVLYPITSVEKITYTSSNKKVAAVSSKGVITAKAAGKAKITVKAGTKKFTITVTVPKTKTTKIKNVPETLNLNLKKKKTYQLKAKCVPSNTDQKLTYSSSKPSIVKVSTTGKLTAKKSGTAVITVKSGSIKVKCKVTVK